MKKFSFHILMLCALFVFVDLQAQTVLFQSDFSDTAVWPEASNVTSVKTTTTSYGTVEYLNIKVLPTDTKTYNSVSHSGYLYFAAGSSTITSSNSYIKLPALTFVNGGVFSIIYGAGSTSRKMQLQEWNSSTSSWSSGSYAEVTTVKSSYWYTQNWTITGSGSKIFRLVLSSAPPMYLPNITVTGNQSTITSSKDTLNFGSKRLSQTFDADSVVITGNSLSSEIVVTTEDPFKINTSSSGSFYSSTTLPTTGGTLYAKFKPTATGSYLDSITLSSSNASDAKVYLKGVALPLSSNDSILSFLVSGYSGKIDQSAKTITVEVSSSATLPLTATPVVTLSEGATLATGDTSLTFNVDSTTYVTAKAEDGSIRTYAVTLTRSATGIFSTTVSPFSVYAYKRDVVIDATKEYAYTIYNLIGNVIRKGTLSAGKNYINLNPGIYIVRVKGKSYKEFIP